MTQRRRRLTAVAATAAMILVAGCSGGRAGTAVPDGDQAAEYVTAKFSASLERLDEDFSATEPRHTMHDSFARIDDKKSDFTLTAIQVGDPPSRLVKNHSNRDSSDYRDYFHPAGSDVEYTLLGPEYASLAPTPWVSEPYDDAGYGPCFWAGYLTVCKMISAVGRSLRDGHAAKTAKSLPDGSVELTAEITLRTFLEERVVVFPDWALERITEEMRDGVIDTRIRLGPDGKLTEIEMTGLIETGGHEVEIDEHYRVLEPPTKDDLPDVPDPEEVTELRTQAEVDDFYRRMDEITSSGG
ncbi:hypothetical protein B0I33_113147 [Prauserella shujinwangii]|uniref:Lipoprotein n=1 Tax=Prauserella shujinwangii TaxID=1453103 RepID=A0A2T0LLR9_9PSEU|nr:hypothetical protein [Prauserella shujinwangii]PRX43981.1 hypothetical protein B0I33_113147 [Prauserella shujinwangii]